MPPTAITLLSALTDAGPSLVVELAERLAVPVRFAEAVLYALAAHGRVTARQEGTPPTMTWRAVPETNPLHAEGHHDKGAAP